MRQLIRIYLIIPFVLISFLILFNHRSFSQEVQPPQEETPVSIQSEIPKPETKEPETLWLWGEVVSADTASTSILVKYLDYETDSEKEITINVDDKTAYENVKSIDEIKPKDTVSIDYIVNPEGKNIAKNITVEKLEAAPVESVVPSETNTSSESEPLKE